MKKIFKLYATIVVCFFALLYCGYSDPDVSSEKDTKTDGIHTFATIENSISFSSTVPTDLVNGYNATSNELAIFAWQEFIALNWPAKLNPTPAPGISGYFRGQASSDNLGSTGSGGTVVWETFHHRVELYPGGQPYNSDIALPDINAVPNYRYGAKITNPVGVDTSLFNNLDEASEINLAEMYFTPLAERVDALRSKYGMTPTTAQVNEIEQAGIKAGIVYEAKANPVMYNYVKTNKFNNAGTRKNANTNSVNVIENMTPSRPGPVFLLPSGTIEIKASWRRYDSSMDDLKEYHWTRGLYYKGEIGQNGTYFETANDTFLLVGLHIIQKTPNIPSFTFATFEHISNEKYGFRYKNTNPLTDSMYAPHILPDDGIRTAIRQYKIPDELVTLNAAIQQQLRSEFGNDIVWANYHLIGVQAKVQNDPGGAVPDQEFFLSNFATETNDALQFFQGGLSGPHTNVPAPDVAHVYLQDPTTKKYTAFTMGGCSGCHGSQGQFTGGDFSVISATGNFFVPEPTEPYPMGVVLDQDPTPYPLPHQQH